MKRTEGKETDIVRIQLHSIGHCYHPYEMPFWDAIYTKNCYQHVAIITFFTMNMSN